MGGGHGLVLMMVEVDEVPRALRAASSGHAGRGHQAVLKPRDAGERVRRSQQGQGRGIRGVIVAAAIDHRWELLAASPAPIVATPVLGDGVANAAAAEAEARRAPEAVAAAAPHREAATPRG